MASSPDVGQSKQLLAVLRHAPWHHALLRVRSSFCHPAKWQFTCAGDALFCFVCLANGIIWSEWLCGGYLDGLFFFVDFQYILWPTCMASFCGGSKEQCVLFIWLFCPLVSVTFGEICNFYGTINCAGGRNLLRVCVFDSKIEIWWFLIYMKLAALLSNEVITMNSFVFFCVTSVVGVTFFHNLKACFAIKSRKPWFAR